MAQPKRTPRLMEVTAKSRITPNMIRVTTQAPWITGLEAGIEGAHCKVFLPQPGQSPEAFAHQLEEGPRPDVRTYTIRHIRLEAGEMDIDFVDHGDAGPASAWARHAEPGDVCGFAGPGPVKLQDFYADFYLIAADMSALPVAAATLEAMPREAQGLALFEITSPEDRQQIDMPEGIEVHWLLHPDPSKPLEQSIARIRALPPFEGRVQTCIAGESGMVKALRLEMQERGLPKADTYISGYWKIGLIEDEHQKVKRAESA